MNKVLDYIRSQEGIASLLIGMLVFLQYFNTIGHDYAWDDQIVILENKRVQQGVSAMPELFKKRNSQQLEDTYGFRPVSLTSFALDIELFGMNPHASHAMNLVYFLILCLVLFQTLRLLFPEMGILFPLLVTVLFIVHPIHTEVVANIKSRDEILALLFSLLALQSFWKLMDEWTWGRLSWVVIFVGLGYLSKESAIAYLGVMALTALVLKKLDRKFLIRLLAPLPILLGLAFVVLQLSYTSTAGQTGFEGGEFYHESLLLGNSAVLADGFLVRLANGLLYLLLYLKNFLVAFPLVYFYGYDQIPLVGWDSPLVWISLLVHGGLLYLGIRFWKKDRLLSWGIFYYLITIFFYSQIAFLMVDTMADRFLFAPSVGLCLIMVYGLGKLFRFDFKQFPIRNWPLRYKAFAGVLLVLFSVYFARTFVRNQAWKDSLTLFETDMPHLENCAHANSMYANGLLTFKGVSLGTDGKLNGPVQPHYQEAIRRFKRAITISDESFYAMMQLGSFYIQLDSMQRAEAVLGRAVRKFELQAEPNFQLGQLYYFRGEPDLALYYLRQAVFLAPNYTAARKIEIASLLAVNRFDRADSLARVAIERFPDDLDFYSLHSDILWDRKQFYEAFNPIFKMMELEPYSNLVYMKLIGRYKMLGDEEKAAFYYQEALQKGIQLPQE